jgi:glycosidase
VQSLSTLDLTALSQRQFTPSPDEWEDEVLYFLLVDRFSDGNENGVSDLAGAPVPGTTPLFADSDKNNAVRNETNAAEWRESGGTWVGGTINGVRSKLGYLKRMGITALWISPVFKQARGNSYHGYAIQDFLEVDSHFGTRDDLRSLVGEAHEQGIRVILDIILNHAGDVFGYESGGRYATNQGRWDGQPYPVAGFRDPDGNAILPFDTIDLRANPNAWPDGAVWPRELQKAGTFTCKGKINNWDWVPEFLEGDFEALKDIGHGVRRMDDGQEDPSGYSPSAALNHLCEVYKYWIAFLDLDGYRVDTVKHMDLGATRYFCSVIHEFAEAIGKHRFYLIGEITGGRDRAFETRAITGLDAALGIDDLQDKLEYLVKGYREPSDYFGLFRNSVDLEVGTHRWFRKTVVTQIDDHDQVRKGNNKARFCAGGGANDRLVLASLALNACTLGIPCVYYGTEQLFDGEGGGDGADKYIREAMFGGGFGAFRSKGRHFFNEQQWVYQELAKILEVRRRIPALSRGRQYLRQISGDGINFGEPRMMGGVLRSIVPWSRIYNNVEVVAAINTDPDNSRTAWVTVDSSLNAPGKQFQCEYSTDAGQIGSTLAVQPLNGQAFRMTVPPAGFVIYG